MCRRMKKTDTYLLIFLLKEMLMERKQLLCQHLGQEMSGGIVNIKVKDRDTQGGESMTDEETALCKRYSRRDENGKVHCYKCPLVIDKNACVCKKVLEKAVKV